MLKILALLITPALAQQAPPLTPEVQALQAKLMQELNSNLQCTTATIVLQQEIMKLKQELVEAKKK